MLAIRAIARIADTEFGPDQTKFCLYDQTAKNHLTAWLPAFETVSQLVERCLTVFRHSGLDPWFDRLTTLSTVEGASSAFKMFWMPDQVRHDEPGTFFGTIN